MEPTARRQALAAALAVASALELPATESVLLNDSNRLVIRLLPCDVVARVVPIGYRVFDAAIGAEREVQIVRQLGEARAPVAELAPQVEPRVFVRDGFEIQLLAHYEPGPTRVVPPDEYAASLRRLHGAMGQLEVATPRFTDRVADVLQWVARRDETPDLADEDREFLVQTIRGLQQSVLDRGAPEQLLHGEPHPWNVLDTTGGPRFVDFENCVRGPVEWDLGWVPSEVSRLYPGADRDLVIHCRGLVLAVVAAHGWRHRDERPGREAAVQYLTAVREGPPWRALDAV